MAFPKSAKILELGCGNGQLWIDNLRRLPPDLSITLTDLSTAMLQEARTHLAGRLSGVKFDLVEATRIPYAASSFDVVIANHMLYHLPNLEAGLAEISRILPPSGLLYTTTNGSNYMTELGELLSRFDPRIDFGQRFILGYTLQNAPRLLSRHFADVEVRHYKDALAVTEAADLINYVVSTGAASNASRLLAERGIDQFRAFLEAEIRRFGSIRITKDSGIVSARKAT